MTADGSHWQELGGRQRGNVDIGRHSSEALADRVPGRPPVWQQGLREASDAEDLCLQPLSESGVFLESGQAFLPSSRPPSA